jgi:hypothetical protein
MKARRAMLMWLAVPAVLVAACAAWWWYGYLTAPPPTFIEGPVKPVFVQNKFPPSN